MTIQVELSPEVEARLAADAVARGMALAQYAGKLLTEAASNAGGSGRLKPGDVERMTKVMTMGSKDLPILPPEATERASFYEDRW
jgi:hypothetical protein